MREKIQTQILSQAPFIAICDSNISEDVLDALNKVPILEPTNTNKPEKKGEETRISKTLYTHLASDYLFLTKQIIERLNQEFQHEYLQKNTEAIQIVEYVNGGFFTAHTDFMNQNPDPTQRFTDRDRIATAIIYLNDDYEGGHTSFPDLSISVTPRKGQILYYEYNPKKTKLEINMKTMHQGDVVVAGTKRIAVQLFLEER
jgi:prolyl 4-hydroxylase